MSKARKIIEDVRQSNGTEVDLVDKGIVNITEVPGLCKYSRTVGVYMVSARVSASFEKIFRISWVR